jgi:type IV pilus assembly protein PilO
MRAHADRLWMLGGAVGVALLVAIGWLGLVKPANDEADALREQTEVSEVQLIALHKRLSDLQQQEAAKATYAAELKRNQQALPAETGMPEFLRQLQTAATAVRVQVTAVDVGAPAQEQGAGLSVWSLPVTLTVAGALDEVGPFLDQVQRIQPRAALVQQTNITGAAEDGAKDADVTATLTMKVFVAPPNGGAPAAGTPTN